MPGVVLCCIFLRTKSTTEGCESISFEYKLLYSSHYATSGFVELDISPVFNKARKANAIVLKNYGYIIVVFKDFFRMKPFLIQSFHKIKGCISHMQVFSRKNSIVFQGLWKLYINLIN